MPSAAGRQVEDPRELLGRARDNRRIEPEEQAAQRAYPGCFQEILIQCFLPDWKLYTLRAGVVSRLSEMGFISQPFISPNPPKSRTEIDGAVGPS